MLSVSSCIILKSVRPSDVLASYKNGVTSSIKSVIKSTNVGDDIKFYTGDRNQNLYVVEEGFNKSTLYATTNAKEERELKEPYRCDRCGRWFIGQVIGKPLSYEETFGSKKIDVTIENITCHPKCAYNLLKLEEPSERNRRSLMILQRICDRMGYKGKLTNTPSPNLAVWNGGVLTPEEFFADIDTPFHTYLVYDRDDSQKTLYYNQLSDSDLEIQYTVGKTVYYRQIIKK